MKVLKFGGTSVGSPERMKSLLPIIKPHAPVIVVLSAVSGTTNCLVEISKCLQEADKNSAETLIIDLEGKYLNFIHELFKHESSVQKGKELIVSHFAFIRSFMNDLFTSHEEKAILAQGEQLSTALFHYYLEEIGVSSALLPALEFMRLNEEGEPDMNYISQQFAAELVKHPQKNVYITQGYICRNHFGEIDNLKRGGSDYTASLIGAAHQAEEIQIWTDIDGMHNNDPRYVKETYPIAELSFDEAAELAYFGAKILHPSSIQPAKTRNIPVRLLNTMNPSAAGTLISSHSSGSNIKAVAAKDGITAIKIKSGRMLLAYGFLRHVFEVFETYKTPIDMITTSEVAVSVTIDDNQHINEIVKDLSSYGIVEVDRDQTIICIVGDFVAERQGYALSIFHSLKEIPIRMISYGGSSNNISLLVDTKDKIKALQLLNEGVFKKQVINA